MTPLKGTLLGLGIELVLGFLGFPILGVGHGPTFAAAGNGRVLFYLYPPLALLGALVL